jgi:hypothetical protein
MFAVKEQCVLNSMSVCILEYFLHIIMFSSVALYCSTLLFHIVSWMLRFSGGGGGIFENAVFDFLYNFEVFVALNTFGELVS